MISFIKVALFYLTPATQHKKKEDYTRYDNRVWKVLPPNIFNLQLSGNQSVNRPSFVA